MKINDDNNPASKPKDAESPKPQAEEKKTSSKVAPKDELIERAMGPSGPNISQPIHISPAPLAPNPLAKTLTAEERDAINHPLKHAFDQSVADTINVSFIQGDKPASRLSRLFGLGENDPEIHFPKNNEFYKEMLPKHLYLEIASANQAGRSVENDYAQAFSKMDENQWHKRLHPTENWSKEKRYETSVYGKTASLRLDQILTILALKTGNSILFRRLISSCMGSGAYLPSLASKFDNPLLVGDVGCILSGAFICASEAFGDSGVRHMQIGKNLFKSYFENIKIVRNLASIQKSGHLATDDATKDVLRTMSEEMFATAVKRLESVDLSASDIAYTAITMEFGVYAAMMMQAAVEHAEARGKSAEEKAKIVTFCADLVVVGITAAVASHFPPILAVIPAALAFVSTHVVPFFVPKTDFKAPLLHIRASAKAGSLGKITGLIDGRYPTTHEMQQRLFYHEMFFAPWDIVADACAGT